MRRSSTLVAVLTLWALLPAPWAQAAVPLELPRTIVFSRTDGTGAEIYAVQPDGSGLTQLTSGSNVNADPAWTADLAAITFTRRTASSTDVWIVDPDGSDPTLFLPNARSLVWGPYFMPGVWSPRGDAVAFVRSRNGNVDIWTAAADGSDRRRLTTHPGRDVQPAWTPDGRLSFVSDLSGRDRIYVMEADGTGLERVTSGPGAQLHPSWYSPNEVVYEQFEGHDRDVVRLWAPTGVVTPIAAGGSLDRDPDVAIDGELVFRRIHLDGSSTLIHRWIETDQPSSELTAADSSDRGPAWAPPFAWIRAYDDQAKGNLLEAAATAQAIRDETGSFDDAGIVGMDAANPSLSYVSEDVDSTGPEEISVAPDGTRWSAAALSDSGYCYSIRLDDIEGVTYGIDSTASASALCSGLEAAGSANQQGW